MEVIQPCNLEVSKDASSKRRFAPDNLKLAPKAMKMGLTALFKENLLDSSFYGKSLKQGKKDKDEVRWRKIVY